MHVTSCSLDQLGWRAFFAQQLTLEDLETGHAARVAGVHRNRLTVLGEQGEMDVVLRPAAYDEDAPVAVGDWVLVEREAPRVLRVLERFSMIARMSAGRVARPQAIAANLDTLFVVTSCNQDFNPSRLERYLSLALAAGVEPVIVLTKIDLCNDPDGYLHAATECAPRTAIAAIDARQRSSLGALERWLGRGQTAAAVGSSGVGKSTLVNTLLGTEVQATSGIREDDAKGRHATTARQLIPIPGGAWLIDTPGMRELKIGCAESGVQATFDEIEVLARDCRFRDCRHEGDEGCALAHAVAERRLDPRRLANYLKLQREVAHAARSTHERRQSERRIGKMHKHVLEQRRRDRGTEL